MSASRLIALFGPTAVGKTEVAIALAQRISAGGGRPVAVSADALQVYAGLETLTGVATKAQQAVLEHRLVSFLPVGTTFSVAEYAKRAHEEIDGLLEEGATPIVVGGTGLYLRAALADLDLRPPPPPGVRERLEAQAERDGVPALHAHLQTVAPRSASEIDPHDRSRVIRALELHEQGALGPRAGESQLWTSDTRHPTRLVGLTLDRDVLHARIDERVEAMVAGGAAEEARRAHEAGASRTARAALGFEELLSGDIAAMKTRTRRYAKRQLTWMRKLPGAELIDVTSRTAEEVAEKVLPGAERRGEVADGALP